jgi:hypothetical protein
MIRIAAPADILKYVAEKGSIAIDGVSLTVNEVEGRRCVLGGCGHARSTGDHGRRRRLARRSARLLRRVGARHGREPGRAGAHGDQDRGRCAFPGRLQRRAPKSKAPRVRRLQPSMFAPAFRRRHSRRGQAAFVCKKALQRGQCRSVRCGVRNKIRRSSRGV